MAALACFCAHADDVDTARAATRSTPSTATSASTRSQSSRAEQSPATGTPASATGTTRNIGAAAAGETTRNIADSKGSAAGTATQTRTATTTRNVATRGGTSPAESAPRTSPASTTNARSAMALPVAGAVPAAGTTGGRGGAAASVRSAVTPALRGTVTTLTDGATAVRSAIGGRTAATGTQTPAPRAGTANRTGTARSAVATEEAPETLPRGDYRTCRNVFFQCMDELCANKNAQLRRCACSNRVHEFDQVKKDLDKIADRMLDFNERLLTVAMDKEDAEVIKKATEGELAYHGTPDRTQSQKILDDIMRKLKTSTEDEDTKRSLAAINLAMDYEDAFDSIDSMMGASMATKEGDVLFRAALPTCREMAEEICDKAEVKTITSAYQMAIEQDCNTIAKTYTGLQDQARGRVFEAGALLDISRLNNYQGRNADDVLECKRKMMDMLFDPVVCGDNLGKCLDWSGRYINPGTGEAILSEDLWRLSEMINRPTDGSTWTRTPGNERFVSFLNAKRKYLEPAMEACEKVEKQAWDAFVEDALPQIRLAQGKKLEEMRLACTGITTKCMLGTVTSFEEFDSRALSIFGVHTDRAVNALCDEINVACSALLNMPTDIEIGTSEIDWQGAMTQIATQKTFEQIMLTCKQVGQNCITQNCNTMSGKFGLCENNTDRQRRNIVNRSICWNDVLQCVLAASKQTDTRTDGILARIMTDIPGEFGINGPGCPAESKCEYYLAGNSTPSADRITYIRNLNGTTSICPNNNSWCTESVTPGTGTIFLNCHEGDTKNEASGYRSSAIMNACRITEKIWGNCNADPKTDGAKIISIHPFEDTLLSWVYTNTRNDGCQGEECPNDGTTDFVPPLGRTATGCVKSGDVLPNTELCPAAIGERLDVSNDHQNCCYRTSIENGVEISDGDQPAKDSFGNCCRSGVQYVNLTSGSGDTFHDKINTSSSSGTHRICFGRSVQYVAKIGTNHLFCDGVMNRCTFNSSGNCIDSGQRAEPVNFIAQGTQNPANSTKSTAICVANAAGYTGKFFVVNENTGLYAAPTYNSSTPYDAAKFETYFFRIGHDKCTLNVNVGGTAGAWSPNTCNNSIGATPSSSPSTGLIIAPMR